MSVKTVTTALLLFALLGHPQSKAQTGTAAPTTKPAASTVTPITVGKDNLVNGPGYTFTAAGGWVMLKSSEAQAVLAGPALKDKLNSTFIVERHDLKAVPKANRTLGVARDVRAEELPATLKDFKWLGERTVKVGGGKVLGILWSYSGVNNGTSFRYTQLTTINNDTLYTVTLAVPEGTLPEVAAQGRAMFDSFKFR